MARRLRIGGAIKDAVMRDLTQAFTTLGYKAAMDAYRSHTFTNRTYNLHDSYGSAVYLNGVLVRDSIRFVNRSRSRKNDRRKGGTGRGELVAFFETASVVKKTDSFTILVAAAMWYAELVEMQGYTVINNDVVKLSMTSNFNAIVSPVLKKYGLESFLPTLKSTMGIDTDYYGK